MANQPDAERPDEYKGLTADQIAAKMARTQVDELLGKDELFIPDFDPNYVVRQEDLAWWSAGGKMPPIDLGFAEGGRVGFQQGTQPATYTEQDQKQDVMNAAPTFVAPTQQGQSPRGTNVLSFEELRARLPQEVSNEVIRLLASSEEALIDFAQIQTQDDIARFNSKYNADLVLPSQTQVV